MHPQRKLPIEPTRIGFLHLPAELRIQIYHYVLPSDCIIFFGRHSSNIIVNYRPLMGPPEIDVLPAISKNCRLRHLQYYNFQFNICLASKVISKEAYAILYGENIFRFEIQRRFNRYRCNTPPGLLDPFDFPSRQRVFGYLQNIVLVIDFDHTRNYANGGARTRARLEKFVKILEKFECDRGNKCHLRNLSIRYLDSLNTNAHHEPYDSPPRSNTLRSLALTNDRFCIERWDAKLMFVAEPLARLKGVEHVECVGFDPWFGSCLEMCVKSEGGDVKEIDWPVRQIRRRKNKSGLRGRKSIAEISKRQWWQPKLDWREFALRNGVAYDPNYDHFFPVVG
ncbi:hypothetical protein DM02DRAFT_651484 [Periconia macrospinosa]|uniref:F-box domain-containing protein n=1 Tax=Periconia macrospinosa TaxID=97972 RepID=A0A2V1E2J3_9PLEO|nr:hypothetical protein DM02DRAFT_651484 [Periconia macrospinosa]